MFAASARGDLRDLNKDLRDLDRAVSEGGLFRLMGNVLELSFNLGQLQSLNPPKQIAADWRTELGELEVRIDAVSDGVTNDTSVRQMRRHIDAVKQRVASLQEIVGRLER